MTCDLSCLSGGAAIESETSAATEAPSETHGTDWFAWLFPVAVLFSRIYTTAATPYYADGWRHLRAIHDRTYVIQPPGYWLFNRLGGLFPNPQLGLSIINWLCSAVGVAVFYACAKRILPDRKTARWATAVYACIFFAWLTGSVFSTYATQLLFPVLVYHNLLLAREKSKSKYLCWAAVGFAIGAGLRPSDGVFLGPMFVWNLFRWPSRREAVLALLIAALLCCVWLVPTAVAFAKAHNPSTAAPTGTLYAATIMTQRSVLAHGLTRQTLANVLRFLVALGFAIWPVAFAALFGGEPLWDRRKLDLWLWILPGFLFFVFLYIGDAGYLNYGIAGVVLLGFLHMRKLKPKMQSLAAALCITFNICFFALYTPSPTRNLAGNVLNVYAGRYTLFNLRYGIDVLLKDVDQDPTIVQPRSYLPGGRWSYIWR